MQIPFEVDGGWPILLARGLLVAALLSLLGTEAFRTLVLPRTLCAMPGGTAQRVGRWLARWAITSLVTAGLAELAWLALQTADFASPPSAAALFAALPIVLVQTEFGHLLLLQWLALFVTAAALAWSRRWPALACATATCALQAGHGHAASMYDGPSLLLAADIVHLLGAGIWLGALVPLIVTVAATPVKAGALAARWFSPLGKAAVMAVAASAAYQGWVLVASIPGLVGTGYGWVVLGKTALFAVLLGFALVNRYRFAPALLAANPASARRVLLRSIGWQTGAAVAVVAAASLLSSMPPSMHVQPVWRFAGRFSLDTVNEDPEFRNEVVYALLALLAAGVLIAVAPFVRRRLRWATLVPAVLVGWFAVPHLDLLFVPAYPTSFFHSPTQFATDSIMQGAALYPANCAICHGATGHGDGPAAQTLTVPPADLTAAHLWAHSDGELFWWLDRQALTRMLRKATSCSVFSSHSARQALRKLDRSDKVGTSRNRAFAA